MRNWIARRLIRLAWRFDPPIRVVVHRECTVTGTASRWDVIDMGHVHVECREVTR